MNQRRLHIAAYDIRHPRRLRRALYVLKGFACGGQKSVFECYLSRAEKAELLALMEGVMDTAEDRFLVAPVPGEQPVQVLGIAVMPADPDCFYVG